MDISRTESAELRAIATRPIATRNLADCCDECRTLLREQLEDEEFGDGFIPDDSQGPKWRLDVK